MYIHITQLEVFVIIKIGSLLQKLFAKILVRITKVLKRFGRFKLEYGTCSYEVIVNSLSVHFQKDWEVY